MYKMISELERGAGFGTRLLKTNRQDLEHHLQFISHLMVLAPLLLLLLQLETSKVGLVFLQRSPLLILLGARVNVGVVVLLLPVLKLLLYEVARVLDIAKDGTRVDRRRGGIHRPRRNILNGAAGGRCLGEGGRSTHATGNKLGETNPPAEGGKVENAGLEVLADRGDEEIPLQCSGKPRGSEDGDGDKDETHRLHHARLLGGHVGDGFLWQRTHYISNAF